jgi:hypothetical protein
MNSLGKELISTLISISSKEILLQKKETTPNNMPWRGKYSEVDYIDSQGFSTVHHNEFFDGLLSVIN